MKDVVVSSKADFESAVMQKAEKITVRGQLADALVKEVEKKKKVKKGVVGGSVALGVLGAIGGIIATVATGGAAAPAAAAGISMLVAGNATVSMLELVALCATVLGLAGIASAVVEQVSKNYNVVVVGNEQVVFARK